MTRVADGVPDLTRCYFIDHPERSYYCKAVGLGFLNGNKAAVVSICVVYARRFTISREDIDALGKKELFAQAKPALVPAQINIK